MLSGTCPELVRFRRRFGGHLIRFALESAGDRGCRRVFAVTTSERVVAFFCRNGFEEVGPDRVPPAKWLDYDPARRGQARCLERET